MEIRVLHVICGKSRRGGACAVALDTASLDVPGCSQSAWVHSCFPAEGFPDVSFVKRGIVRAAHLSIIHDLIAGIIECYALGRYIRNNGKCILHAHTRTALVASLLAGRIFDCPVVLHFHHFAKKAAVYGWLVRNKHVFPVANSQKTRAYYGFRESVPVIMPCLAWPPCPDQRRSQKDVKFVTASEIVPIKKIDRILDAWELLQKRPPDAKLVVFGFSDKPLDRPFSAEMSERLEQIANAEGAGWDERWMTKTEQGDVYVHLCAIESFGLSLLEAFSRGMKIVSIKGTFLDSLPEAVSRPGIYLAEDDTAESVADAMKRALNDRIDAGALWAERSKVAGMFSPEHVSAELANVYKKVYFQRSLAGGSKRGV